MRTRAGKSTIERYVPADIKHAIRWKYAWPGGYPLFLITADSACLCVECGKKEYRQLAEARRDKDKRGGWYVEGADVNWEDPNLYCDHCSQRIESAYAEKE